MYVCMYFQIEPELGNKKKRGLFESLREDV